MKGTNDGRRELELLSHIAATTNRRTFLKWSGVSFAVIATGCQADNALRTDNGSGPNAQQSGGPVSLGTGDVLVLNFALALEQLEAAFYTRVTATPYSGISQEEQQILEDLRKHEVIHRDFLKEALGPAAIPDLEFDFSSVNFSSRASVLGTAQVFEDTGVSAYNGAAKFLENTDFLVTAGKIVSVEARHAAAIRDLLQPKTAFFAGDDVVNAQGLDIVRTPAQVATLVDPFIVTVIDTSALPNS
ncbi:MAG: ferritin-like domain-containing protein [Gemmatimonadaceae bacterium]